MNISTRTSHDFSIQVRAHRVGEDRVGIDGTAGQYDCTVFHLVVGTASLDKKAWAEYLPHVAVLLTIHKHMNKFILIFEMIVILFGVFVFN